MASEIVKIHVFIQGKVQGVFYRSWMKSNALALGLKGWAKNLEDGRVEAVIQGPKAEVEEILQKCREGNSSARVTHMDVSYEDIEEGFVDFKIIS